MANKINRIYHPSLMQTMNSQPKGKWIMLETRFTEFQAFFADLRVGISWSASETDNRLFFLPVIGKIEVLKRIFTINML